MIDRYDLIVLCLLTTFQFAFAFTFACWLESKEHNRE